MKTWSALVWSVLCLAATTTATASHPADKAGIRALIEQHRGEVEACYEAALERAPGLEGRVVVGFTIQADGRLEGVEVSQSSLGDEGAEACIASAGAGWTFAAEGGRAPLEVRYPFAFSAGD